MSPSIKIDENQPISRTYRYRKVMKPLLERKRRARINNCLDELKDFILDTLQTDGENVSKLEKADILEFTVQYLQKLRRQNALQAANAPAAAPTARSVSTDAERFRAGFKLCANEVSRCLDKSAGIDIQSGRQLMIHLGNCLHEMTIPAESAALRAAPAVVKPPPTVVPRQPKPTATLPPLQQRAIRMAAGGAMVPPQAARYAKLTVCVPPPDNCCPSSSSCSPSPASSVTSTDSSSYYYNNNMPPLTPNSSCGSGASRKSPTATCTAPPPPRPATATATITSYQSQAPVDMSMGAAAATSSRTHTVIQHPPTNVARAPVCIQYVVPADKSQQQQQQHVDGSVWRPW